MADETPATVAPVPSNRLAVLFHFCRFQLPGVAIEHELFRKHIDRTYRLFQAKATTSISWSNYLDSLYALDWYLCCGCLERNKAAWELLFATRTGRSDCLLIDALRARAVRLYPRNEEKQESAVSEFWSGLLISETSNSTPVLARYDGQRPLAPWLIRVFQNFHISKLRGHSYTQALPEDDLAMPLPERPDSETRWHEAFRSAAQEWLNSIEETELLLLGLLWRYRLSQRDVSTRLKKHEGTISRQVDKLNQKCKDHITERLIAEGWTGEDLGELIRTEMASVLQEDTRLTLENLRGLLAKHGVDPAKEEEDEE